MAATTRPGLREVGRYVQALRGEMGISQGELARRAGVDAGTVNSLENGSRWPWAQSRTAIEKALGITVGELAERRALAETQRAA